MFVCARVAWFSLPSLTVATPSNGLVPSDGGGSYPRPEETGLCAASWVNTSNGKRYVGSAVNLRLRRHKHIHDLASGKNCNHILVRAWKKYGEDFFEFHILELVDKPRLLEVEQRYIDELKPEYNIARIAGSRYGLKIRPESMAKRMETISNPLIRAKMGNGAKNAKGKYKGRLSPFKGMKNRWTPEQLEKIRINRRANPPRYDPWTQERRNKLSASQRAMCAAMNDEEKEARRSKAMNGLEHARCSPKYGLANAMRAAKSRERDPEALRLFSEGASLVKIGKIIGVGAPYVIQIIDRNLGEGAASRRYAAVRDAIHTKIREMRDNGASISDTAAKLKCSKKTVRKCDAMSAS
jgi:group I intron endonuclease